MCDHLQKIKFSKSLPHAFTEHGALMLASVLNSERAVEMSLAVIRVFVKLREMLSAHKELAAKIRELEDKSERHNTEIQAIFKAIRQLMAPLPTTSQRPIGFHP
jgi:phage regulator Rha-like protein